MIRKTIVTTYHTNPTYEACANSMRQSAQAVGLDCLIYPEAHDTYRKVTGKKPNIIRKALKDSGEHVLFVDADCVFHSPPVLLDRHPYPMACHYRGPWAFPNVLWIRGGDDHAMRMLDRWQQLMEASPEEMPRKLLSPAIKQADFKPYRLPPAYAWIERLFRRRFPKCRPVIEDMAIDQMNPDSGWPARGGRTR